MNGADLGAGLRCEERKYVVGGLALFDLPNGRPVSPDTGEAGEGNASRRVRTRCRRLPPY